MSNTKEQLYSHLTHYPIPSEITQRKYEKGFWGNTTVRYNDITQWIMHDASNLFAEWLTALVNDVKQRKGVFYGYDTKYQETNLQASGLSGLGWLSAGPSLPSPPRKPRVRSTAKARRGTVRVATKRPAKHGSRIVQGRRTSHSAGVSKRRKSVGNK